MQTVTFYARSWIFMSSHAKQFFLLSVIFWDVICILSMFHRWCVNVCRWRHLFQQQQQQLVAIDNSRTLISSLLRHMASLSSSLQTDDKRMTLRHNDAAVLSQSERSRASSSSSSSSERHTSSSADSGLSMHCSSLSVINDVMNVTSEDSYTSFVNAVVAFIKVHQSVCLVIAYLWPYQSNCVKVHQSTWPTCRPISLTVLSWNNNNNNNIQISRAP